jgi:hypothetical protein
MRGKSLSRLIGMGLRTAGQITKPAGVAAMTQSEFCSMFTQLLPFVGDHLRQRNPLQGDRLEPQPAHATVSSCKSFL